MSRHLRVALLLLLLLLLLPPPPPLLPLLAVQGMSSKQKVPQCARGPEPTTERHPATAAAAAAAAVGTAVHDLLQ
jgi:hypothetical protein